MDVSQIPIIWETNKQKLIPRKYLTTAIACPLRPVQPYIQGLFGTGQEELD